MRLKIVAGNWKMNNTKQEAEDLITKTLKHAANVSTQQLVIFAVPFPYLQQSVILTQGNKGFAVAAQNCASHAKGAYTGEVSAAMLASLQITYCIVGHSERRVIYKENSDDIIKKCSLLLEHQISPIWCCGESIDDRKNGNYLDIIENQLEHEVFKLSEASFAKVIIAYEPIWAIGTGLTASADQAQEVHQFIRKKIEKKYSSEMANKIPILYGGSCTPENAGELFAQKDIDGGLIGGASLKADSFVKLISRMNELY